MVSSDEYAVLVQDGVFLAPLMYLRNMEIKYSHPHRRSKELAKETPSWYLFFKDKHYTSSRSFLHKTLTSLTAIANNPTMFTAQNFHSETGVISQHLVKYLRSVEDIDRIMTFISNFRAYASGKKKRMPRNISHDQESYNQLKTAVKTEYAQRLIEEYKARNLDSTKKTQDFAILYRMPLYTLLETVFCSLDDDDVVRAIEEYRV